MSSSSAEKCPVRVLFIIGTRPEAIKMAPVIRALNAAPDGFHSVVCVTGQHREMLDQVLALFQIHPDYDLDLMRADQSLADLTAGLFTGLDRVAREVQPDWILAQGDTTTVLVAGLVAFYHRVRFGHVEAGLRSGNRFNPFPEEINRRVADLVADAYFAPTERARKALLSEGCSAAAIHVTGNTVIDALHYVSALPHAWTASPLRNIPQNRRLVLITAHRRESFGEPFREICLAIHDLAERFPDTHFVYPVHLNPHARRPVFELLKDRPNLHLLDPLSYVDLVHLMKSCALILTDSGGIQEEAPGLRIPVLVMRETTERPEGIEAGVVKLVGTRREQIVREAATLLTDSTAHAAMATGANPYGDGRAAARIVAVLDQV